jgi:hypothetical protein
VTTACLTEFIRQTQCLRVNGIHFAENNT